MRDKKELVKFLDEEIKKHEFGVDDWPTQEDEDRSISTLTEIKWNLKEYEKLKKKHFKLCFEMNAIRHRPPDNDLVEKLRKIDHHTSEISGDWTDPRYDCNEIFKLTDEIRKLLQGKK